MFLKLITSLYWVSFERLSSFEVIVKSNLESVNKPPLLKPIFVNKLKVSLKRKPKKLGK